MLMQPRLETVGWSERLIGRGNLKHLAQRPDPRECDSVHAMRGLDRVGVVRLEHRYLRAAVDRHVAVTPSRLDDLQANAKLRGHRIQCGVGQRLSVGVLDDDGHAAMLCGSVRAMETLESKLALIGRHAERAVAALRSDRGA